MFLCWVNRLVNGMCQTVHGGVNPFSGRVVFVCQTTEMGHGKMWSTP